VRERREEEARAAPVGPVCKEGVNERLFSSGFGSRYFGSFTRFVV
jgi:hypothetical protein